MPRPTAYLVILLAVSCTSDAGPPSDALPEWVISDEPLLVIGETGRAGHELFRVKSAARLSDGRIAIANVGTSEIRFFDRDGQHLGTAGREGQGPQEFRRIETVALAASDTLLVYTWDSSVAVVSPSMEIVRKEPINMQPMIVPCRLAEGGVHLASDGAFIIQADDNRGTVGCGPMSSGKDQVTTLLTRFHPDEGRLDTLGIFPGTDRDGRRYGAFGRMLEVAISDHRIFAGETGGDTISVFDLDGTPRGIWRVPLPATPLTEAARSYDPPPRRMGDGSVVPEDPYTMPENYPRFGRLLADRSQNLWIMAYPPVDDMIRSWRMSNVYYHYVPDGGAEWLVVGSNGDPLARATTPAGLFPLEIGDDYVLGLAKDSLDVETVRLHRLTR